LGSLPIKQEVEKPKASYSEKMEFQKLEKRISELEGSKSKINHQFLTGELDGTQIQELSIRLGEIDKELSQSEERWMELAEKIGV
jgi:chromosome segregation ATPase